MNPKVEMVFATQCGEYVSYFTLGAGGLLQIWNSRIWIVHHNNTRARSIHWVSMAVGLESYPWSVCHSLSHLPQPFIRPSVHWTCKLSNCLKKMPLELTQNTDGHTPDCNRFVLSVTFRLFFPSVVTVRLIFAPKWIARPHQQNSQQSLNYGSSSFPCHRFKIFTLCQTKLLKDQLYVIVKIKKWRFYFREKIAY